MSPLLECCVTLDWKGEVYPPKAAPEATKAPAEPPRLAHASSARREARPPTTPSINIDKALVFIGVALQPLPGQSPLRESEKHPVKPIDARHPNTEANHAAYYVHRVSGDLFRAQCPLFFGGPSGEGKSSNPYSHNAPR